MTHTDDMERASLGADSEALRFLVSLEDLLLGRGSWGSVLGCSPGQMDALMALGDRLILSGRLPEALAIFEGVQVLDPGRSDLQERLSLCRSGARLSMTPTRPDDPSR